jgi:Copper transport outer membrane protein, MctB
MFDYRYHALSLAAVLFALAVGVLIGVAIGDSKLVSSARDGIVQNLRSEVKSSHHSLEETTAQLGEQERIVVGLWHLAVHDLLAGRSIGLVFLGESSDQVDAAVRDGVEQAGGEVKAVVAVREPLDLAGIAAGAAGTRYAALGSEQGLISEPGLVKQFGLRVGRQLVAGGQLIERVRTRLLSSYDGELGHLEGIVFARSEPEGMEPKQARVAAEFESGLIAGAVGDTIPGVGVESTSTEPSQVSWYKHEGLSSVDDVGTVDGRAALAFALAGHRGAFGAKPSAEAPLPSVENVFGTSR